VIGKWGEGFFQNCRFNLCGSINKDEQQGYYVLNQWHTAWQYRLVPIPN
jgi:hypothetical protein